MHSIFLSVQNDIPADNEISPQKNSNKILASLKKMFKFERHFLINNFKEKPYFSSYWMNN